MEDFHYYLCRRLGGGREITVKNLFAYADKYLQKSNWKDMALLKFCLFSTGILVGMQVPDKEKKRTAILAALVFTVTYIPLMTKFIRVVMEEEA